MRYVCCHAHFYQPERADPWSRQVVGETNWNERITIECYRPLYEAGLLSKMSWNIFPSLFNWLAIHHPDVARGFQEADAESLRQTGNGCAIASPYVHMIAPLMTEAEWRWSVARGISHFKRAFKRNPKGMWLPESATSWEIMDEASRQGIEYFILMSHQTSSVKPLNKKGKIAMDNKDNVNTDFVYDCSMSDGRKTRIVFANTKIKKCMSDMGYLMHPEGFSNSLLTEWNEVNDPGVLVMATDGEYYGHHFGNGVKSIKKALRDIDHYGADVVPLDTVMQKLPIHGEVDIRDNTSWTCIHGVARWNSNCGCRHDNKHRDQSWKAPLSAAVNKLTKIAHDAWLNLAEDKKMHLKMAQDVDTAFLEGNETIRQGFVAWMTHNGSVEARRAAYDLMELRCFAFLLKNSCVFYFDTLDRDEIRQSMKYAAKMAWIMESFGIQVFSWLLPALKEIVCEGLTAQQIFISSIQEVPETWCKERGLPSPEGLMKLAYGN